MAESEEEALIFGLEDLQWFPVLEYTQLGNCACCFFQSRLLVWLGQSLLIERLSHVAEDG